MNSQTSDHLTLPERLATKDAAVEAWNRGWLGNKLRSWSNFIDLWFSGYEGLVTLRSRKPDSRLCQYGLTVEQAADAIHSLEKRGHKPSEFYFNEAAPDDKLCFQGEVQRSDRFVDLTYSVVPGLRMRPAMLNEHGVQHATGLRALAIMRHYMDPATLDDFDAIWERWPHAVLEFSTYRITLGDRPGRNTIVWEGREY